MNKKWEEEVQNPNYKDTPLRKVLKKLYADGWEASSSTDNGDCVEAYVIAEEEVLKYVRQREKELLDKWGYSLEYAQRPDGAFNKKILFNHYKMVKEELSNE